MNSGACTAGSAHDTLWRMFTRALLLPFACLLVFGQASDEPAALQKQSEALRSLVGRSPRLPLEKTEFQIKPAGIGWELGYRLCGRHEQRWPNLRVTAR